MPRSKLCGLAQCHRVRGFEEVVLCRAHGRLPQADNRAWLVSIGDIVLAIVARSEATDIHVCHVPTKASVPIALRYMSSLVKLLSSLPDTSTHSEVSQP